METNTNNKEKQSQTLVEGDETKKNASQNAIDVKNLPKPRWMTVDDEKKISKIYEFQNKVLVVANPRSNSFSTAGSFFSSGGLTEILETDDFDTFRDSGMPIENLYDCEIIKSDCIIVNGLWFTNYGKCSKDGITFEEMPLMEDFGNSSLKYVALYFQHDKWYLLATYRKPYSYTVVGKIFDSEETYHFDAFVLFESADLKNWLPISMYKDDFYKYNATSFFAEKGLFFMGFVNDRDMEDNFLMASSDGREWTKVLTHANSRYLQVQYFKDRFFIFGMDKDLYVSEDGFSWKKEKYNLSIDLDRANNLCRYSENFTITPYPELGLLMARNYDSIYFSNDGLEWVPISIPKAFSDNIENVFLVNNHLIVTSKNGTACWKLR